MRIVPDEPTEEMDAAGWAAYEKVEDFFGQVFIPQLWQDMLAAAPDVSEGLVEATAKAVYHAAFNPMLPTPSPGWCWEKAGSEQQKFALRQARAALQAIKEWKGGGAT